MVRACNTSAAHAVNAYVGHSQAIIANKEYVAVKTPLLEKAHDMKKRQFFTLCLVGWACLGVLTAQAKTHHHAAAASSKHKHGVTAHARVKPAQKTAHAAHHSRQTKLVQTKKQRRLAHNQHLQRAHVRHAESKPRLQPVSWQRDRAEANLQSPSTEADLHLASSTVLVVNQSTGDTLYAKRADPLLPIASITKLMTAMVVLDAGLDMNERITLTDDDVDALRHTSSRLRVGTVLTREELLHVALMSSENRAAAALSRAYPGGRPAFVAAMNKKATDIGMRHARFHDGTGLNGNNQATAMDLVRMVSAAYMYPKIREFTTSSEAFLTPEGYRRPLHYVNTNALVREGEWQIGLSKTGFINEAGRCLVMQAMVSNTPMIFVLLDAAGKSGRIVDAIKLRQWLEAKLAASHGSS